MASVMAASTDAPSAAKRASSRVRRQPDHYNLSPFANGKRKRGDNRDEIDDEDANMLEDGSEDDEDDESDQEDDEPAEEELRERAQRARKPRSSAPKKPAQKKPKVNGMSLPIRGTAKAPAKRRAPRKLKVADSEDAEAAGGLYAELFAHGKSAEEAVSDWIKAFDQHESAALTDLVNFVLKAAGCDSKVHEHDIEDPDGATARLTDLQDEHQATEPTDYPMIAKGKNALAFKANVIDFVQTLIKAIGANGYLCSNPELIENIHVWLSTMSSATNRSFRHTSTVCSLAILGALCEVAKEYATRSADNRRHAEGERKKSRANKERVKQLEEKSRVASADLETIESLLKDWFDTVFIHRYRDVDAAVRRDCVEGLGDWIVTLPDQFLDGNHLRYMGWLLSDESSVARLETLKQLRRLYGDIDKLSGLKTFTERFRPRMVEIGTSDADIGVRVAGIQLLDLLREHDLLEPDDIDAIGRLVFHDDIKVRRAVAGFFSANVSALCESKIEELGGLEALEEVIPDSNEDNFEVPRLDWLSFKALAEMLQAYDQDDCLPSQVERSQADGTLILHAAGVESRFTLAVDVLCDKIDDLREWQALAGYLLFDHSSARTNGVSNDTLSQLKHETVLTENEEIVLLEVLNASAKRILSDLAEKITGSKAKLSKKQKEELQEEQEEAVRNLTEVIPKLLKKFGDLPSTAGAVLRLGGVLALPSLQGLRQDSVASAALLDDLRKQFMSHGTDEVLAPATAAILHAQSYGELDDAALEKLSSLWEDVVSNLAELLDADKIKIRGASEHEELLALSNNLLRIVRLATVSNCIPHLEDESIAQVADTSGKEYKAAIDYILDLLHRAVLSFAHDPNPEEAALEDLIATRAAEAALFYFRWKLTLIMAAIRTGTNASAAYEDDTVLEALAERRDLYATNLGAVLTSRRPSDPVCVAVAACHLDLYTSSAVLRTESARPGMSDDYTVLIVDLDSKHEKAIMKVFIALESEYAKLSGKRLDLSSSGDAEAGAEADPNADPIDEDPLSDDEDDEANQAQIQASQQLRDAKLMKPVVVEERLCHLTTKLVWAIIAGVIDDKAIRKRLERNKTKLGANFKEVLAYLDVSGMEKKTAKGKAKPKPSGAASGAALKKPHPKSNAIVAEDEEDDDIEDGDGEDAEESRRREVEMDDERPLEEEDDAVVSAGGDVSVAGD